MKWMATIPVVLMFSAIVTAAEPLALLQPQSTLASQLPPRKPIKRMVALSGETDLSPLIGCPATMTGMEHGREIARMLKQKFGVDAEVVPATQVDPQDFRRRTVILPGNISTNPEILWLYTFNYSFADAAYPGGDGYVIRQVFDPVGAGRNALVIGASSEDGLASGVRRFCDELERLDAPLWTQSLIVKSAVDVVSGPPPPLDKTERETLYHGTLRRMKSGQLWKEAHAIIDAAHAWSLTENEVYLQRYDTMTRAHRVLTDSRADQLYGGLEFWMASYIQAWDIVEEAEFWTDAQRDRKTQLVLDLAAALEKRYRSFAAAPSPRPRWNHETHPALAYFYLSKYLEKYYNGVQPAPEFRRAANLVLGDQTQFVRGTDESGLYLPYAPTNALRYAIASRQRDMIDSGRAVRFGQLLRIMTDNTGRFVGAANRESQNIAYQFLLPLAVVTGNTVTAGLDRKTRLAIQQPNQPNDDWGAGKRFGEYRPPVADVAANVTEHGSGTARLRQITAFPMDPGLFAMTNTERFYSRVPLVKTHVNSTQAFDKLVFRDGFGSTGQYLLLDGYGRGKHYRYDTNAILRFTADDRVFLVGTDDDQRVAETYHNTLSFIRDGRGHDHVPPFAALESVADFPETGFSCSTVQNYSGLNWSRNILWLKGSLFAVADHLEALRDGEFHLRCHWNGLGRITTDDAAFHLEQNGRSCTVTGDGLARISVTEDRSEPASRWSGYPHAPAVIQRIRQTRTLKMQNGDRTIIPNVICTHDSAILRTTFCRVVAPGVVLISDNNRQRLFCVSPTAVPSPFSTDAKLALIEEQRITLVQATTLRDGEDEIFHSSEPVDCVLNANGDPVSLSSQTAGRKFSWLPSPNLRQTLDTVLTNALDQSAVQHPEQSVARDTLESLESELPFTIRTALLPAVTSGEHTPIVIGTDEGCHALSIDNSARVRRLWRLSADSPVTALARGRRGSDDPSIIYGTRDGDVVSVTYAGSELWRQRLDASEAAERQVSCLISEDTDHDGRGEVFVGTGRWNVFALDDNGRQLWKTAAYARRIVSMAAGDLSGNQVPDLLIGTSYYTLSAYDAKGHILFGHTGEPQFQHVLISDMDGDSAPEAVAANGSRLLILEIRRDGLTPRRYAKGMSLPRATTVRATFDTGDRISALAVNDLNSDGKPEIFAAAESGYVYCIDGHGKLLHMRNTGAAVHTLAIGAGPNGQALIAVSLEDCRVVVFNGELNPVGESAFSHVVQWLRVQTDRILCATPKSIGLIPLN